MQHIKPETPVQPQHGDEARDGITGHQEWHYRTQARIRDQGVPVTGQAQAIRGHIAKAVYQHARIVRAGPEWIVRGDDVHFMATVRNSPTRPAENGAGIVARVAWVGRCDHADAHVALLLLVARDRRRRRSPD